MADQMVAYLVALMEHQMVDSMVAHLAGLMASEDSLACCLDYCYWVPMMDSLRVTSCSASM